MTSDYPLAVIATRTGGCSETFIKRHMFELLPERTVVVCSFVDPDDCCWKAPGPALVRGTRLQYKLRRLFYQRIDPIRTRAGLGINEFGMWQRKVRQFLSRHNVRAVLGEYLDTSHVYLQTTKALDMRFIVHGHGYDISKLIKNPKWRRRYRDYNDSTGVVTINSVSKTRLTQCGIAPDKVHIVPYGVDVPLQYPSTRDGGVSIDQEVRCIAVGRLVAKKAPVLLLESFAMACRVRPDLRLDVVGDGPLWEVVSELIDRQGIADRVIMHGRKPNEFVRNLFASADIFLQHSITDPQTGDEEGLPVAILEAMAQGLPVISTRHAGIPDEVIDGETGYLVEETDTRAMADRIVRLSENRAARIEMGRAGWWRAKECFSWDNEKRRLLRLLELDQSASG